MNKTTITAVLAGRFTTRSLLAYITVTFSIAIAFLAAATIMLHLHAGFSFMVNDISSTGSPSRNPGGWPLFTGFMLIAGAIMVPVAVHYRRAMGTLGIPGTGFVSACYVLGSAGTALVGISPSEIVHGFHLAFAVVAFGGHGLGLVAFLIGALRARQYRVAWPYVALFTVIAGLFVTQGYVIFTGGADFDAFRGSILSVSLWEWSLFFTIVFTLVATSVMLARALDGQPGLVHGTRPGEA